MLLNHFYPNTIHPSKIISNPRSHHDYRINLRRLQEGLTSLEIKCISLDVYLCLSRSLKCHKWLILTIGTWYVSYISCSLETKGKEVSWVMLVDGRQRIYKIKLILPLLKIWLSPMFLILFLRQWKDQKWVTREERWDGRLWIWSNRSKK